MKTLVLAAMILMTAAPSFAATVRGAKLDASEKNILIDVTYGGGCGKHEFSLKSQGGCLETNPVQCTVQLIEKTDDHCEALVGDTVVINLKEAGLTGRYFSNAYLTITGDHDWKTKKPSQATVQLPK